MRRLALLLPVIVAGCGVGCGGGKAQTPYLGKWSGAFEGVRMKAGGGDAQRLSLRGDLQIYVRRFEMNLTGPQQGVVVKGSWTLKPNARGEPRLALRADDVKIDDGGGEDRRDPNKPYLKAEAVKDYFSRELVLKPSSPRVPDALIGPDDDLGPVVVRPSFRRS